MSDGRNVASGEVALYGLEVQSMIKKQSHADERARLEKKIPERDLGYTNCYIWREPSNRIVELGDLP